ncbi:MAG TPA: ATP-binding protein [Gemmatimonadaceae bacterium]|nr:ATP-binding protein [Gemmatimonadaceae bacterium]
MPWPDLFHAAARALRSASRPALVLAPATLPARDPRAVRLAELERDLAEMQRLLHGYLMDREATEEALRESEERYRSIFLRAAFGIFRAAPGGRFLEVNPALIAMLGHAQADTVLRLTLDELYADDEAPRHVPRPGEPSAEDWYETRWRRSDGEVITVRLIVRAKIDAFGDVRYLEGIAEDVTERQRRDELLRRSERMASLGTTLAGVAHELNNPLAAVIGFTQLLRREARRADDVTALDTIEHEARRAARIVRELLAFSRRQEGGRDLVNLNDIVSYIMSTRRYALETRGIVAELDLAPALPPVTADATQLEQVVLNLLLNAEQALVAILDAAPGTPPARPPRLTVVTGVDGAEVVLDVADTGVGIRADDIPRIWDPFWTTKPEGEGTGLGLSVVHGIVDSHSGTIEVESVVDQGTRFRVRLPAATAVADATVAARRGAPEPQPSRALDILVVDDEPSILRFLEHYLTSRGHAVLTANDGAQALRLAERTAFDVVICDIRMPGMDGYEVLARLRRLPHGGQARCIVSTGVAVGGAGRAQLEELGVWAIIPKPYEVEQLREVVEEGAGVP